MGIEKVLPRFADLEVMLQLLPRSSTGERMNPYTSLWTGVHAGRRPAGVPPRAARRRPHRRARRRGRPPGAALHPLLGLPERLPGLRAHRRARVRVDLSRADRGDPDAAAGRARARHRRCPGPRRCAAPATRSARSRSTSPRCSCTCARGSCAERRGGARIGRRGERAAMRAMAACSAAAARYELAQRAARAGWPLARDGGSSAGCPGRWPAGPPCATSARPPQQTLPRLVARRGEPRASDDPRPRPRGARRRARRRGRRWDVRPTADAAAGVRRERPAAREASWRSSRSAAATTAPRWCAAVTRGGRRGGR